MNTPRETILLVDDEEALRWILNRGLTMRGYRCQEAGTAEQALDNLEFAPSELVILDINMPGRLGNEVLPEIKARFPRTAVIMASGVTDTSVIARCIKDGAHDYLGKPFRFEQVLRSVSRALDQRRLELEIQDYLKDLGQRAGDRPGQARRVFLRAIEGLVHGLEASDRYTAEHSREVMALASAIGKKLGLPAAQIEDIRWAALLHDVGKIAVDPDILNKPGELTASEYRHIMTHAVVGPSLIKPFVNDSVVEIISHHHDQYDGGGLDQLTVGEEIPLGARIVAVADAYQAMTSDRPYRPALSKEDSIQELVCYSGRQFDPVVARVLIDLIGRPDGRSHVHATVRCRKPKS